MYHKEESFWKLLDIFPFISAWGAQDILNTSEHTINTQSLKTDNDAYLHHWQ